MQAPQATPAPPKTRGKRAAKPAPHPTFPTLGRIRLLANNRGRKDIASWRAAIQVAENIYNPRRTLLYNLYDELVLDTHLSGLFDQRRLRVMGTAFALVDTATGEKLPDLVALLDAPWFTDFLKYALDSVAWGHSLIELGTLYQGRITGCTLIPRRHVVPERGMVTFDQFGDSGILYREEAEAEWLIEVGGSNDLGLMAKAAPQMLFKRNALMAWSEFAEVFGMPLRVGYTAGRDEAGLDRMAAMLRDMGSASYGVFQEGEKIEFVESAKVDAYKVYDELIDRCNKEVSKLVLGSTMVLDDGSSRSQAEVHERASEEVVEADRRMLERLINTRLLPLLAAKGYPLANAKFVFDRQEHLPIKDRWQMVVDAATLGLPLDLEQVRTDFSLPLQLDAQGNADPAATEDPAADAEDDTQPDSAA